MSELSQFQALITGAVHGALMKANAEGPFLIDSEIGVDQEGNYTNEILVTGRKSGERLLVRVERVEQTPEGGT